MLQKTSHGVPQKLINPERILEERETGEIVDQIVPCLVSGLSIKTDQHTYMISLNTILLNNFENSLKIRLYSFYSSAETLYRVFQLNMTYFEVQDGQLKMTSKFKKR